MNIMLRTSGGRGEYELAGSQHGIRVADVAGRPIIFSITPEIAIPGRSRCLSTNESQGKPRIRLENQGRSGEMHAYLVLRSLLLLPEPIRELSETGTGPLMIENRKFSINAISVDVVSVSAGQVVLRPTAIEFRNAANNREIRSVADLMSKVLEIWRASEGKTGQLADLIRAHRDTVLQAPHLHSQLSSTATRIQQLVGTAGEFVSKVAAALGATLPDTEPEADEEPQPILTALPEEDSATVLVVKRRYLKLWRKQRVRGPEASQFRREVRNVYGGRCAFSGVRLPKLPITNSAGVDAAHILPWSRYELNHVSNGLCLSKLFHWAFDNGILRLDFLPVSSRYQLSIPDAARDAAHTGGMDLTLFEPHLGLLPAERFPATVVHRPRREFLEKLNAESF